ncbi:hypothetical protein BH23BAC1_BH23BAC1_00780 [soil metagenome]
MKQLFLILAIIGLYGTMTNLFMISPIPSLISAILVPLILFSIITRRKIPKMVFWLILYFLISFISILIYYPQSFSYFTFYRFDGNFIISYLPLLVLPFFSANLNIEKIFKYLLYFVTIINIINLAWYYYVGASPYFGFFTATNAAGGFFSIMASLAFVYFLRRKTYWNLLLFLLQIVFLIFTTSRGSMFGLSLGIFFFLCVKYRKSYFITLSILTIIVVQIYLFFTFYPIYENNFKHLPKDDFYLAVGNYIHNNHGYVDGKTANILIRLYDTWPRGVDTFINSPLVGAGFGSINDIPFKYETVIPNLIRINNQDSIQFSSSHAHHSFLHILGEQGIIGLIVFLMFWISIYKFLLRNGQNPQIRNFLLISFFNLTVMSFTEHRITTPSNALPFVLALGIYYVYVNHQKKLEEEVAFPEKNE